MLVTAVHLIATLCFLMNTRDWNILCWNIRAINGSEKWDAVRDKIEKVLAQSFVYRKQKESLLICLSSGNLPHADLTVLILSHRSVLLVGYLLSGTA